MSQEKELFYLLALQSAKGVGDMTARRLIDICGSAEAVFAERAAVLQRVERVGAKLVKAVLDPDNFRAAERELVFLQGSDIRALQYTDKDFPDRLRHCADGPILLFTRGSMDLNAKRMISVVGTRRLTAQGRNFCEQFIQDLAPMDPVIISGYAYGADIAAHREAIKHGLTTVACMAHGLNQTYPAAHRNYNRAMEANGGFVTDFHSVDGPDRDHFLRRNRIIAGLSEAVVVIESAEKGGSLVTADIANSYDREVFAVPGKPGDRYSKGCNALIKRQRAHLLEGAADLLYILGWDPEEQAGQRAIQTALFQDLNSEEALVYDALAADEKMQLDDIAIQSRLPVYKVTGLLLSMELKGVVRPLPGNYFEAVISN